MKMLLSRLRLLGLIIIAMVGSMPCTMAQPTTYARLVSGSITTIIQAKRGLALTAPDQVKELEAIETSLNDVLAKLKQKDMSGVSATLKTESEKLGAIADKLPAKLASVKKKLETQAQKLGGVAEGIEQYIKVQSGAMPAGYRTRTAQQARAAEAKKPKVKVEEAAVETKAEEESAVQATPATVKEEIAETPVKTEETVTKKEEAEDESEEGEEEDEEDEESEEEAEEAPSQLEAPKKEEVVQPAESASKVDVPVTSVVTPTVEDKKPKTKEEKAARRAARQQDDAQKRREENARKAAELREKIKKQQEQRNQKK